MLIIHVCWCDVTFFTLLYIYEIRFCIIKKIIFCLLLFSLFHIIYELGSILHHFIHTFLLSFSLLTIPFSIPTIMMIILAHLQLYTTYINSHVYSSLHWNCITQRQRSLTFLTECLAALSEFFSRSVVQTSVS